MRAIEAATDFEAANALLAEYDGSECIVWRYTSSLRALELRLQRHGPQEQRMHLVCFACSRFTLVTAWGPVSVRIVDEGAAGFMVKDQEKQLVACGAISLYDGVGLHESMLR